MKIALTAVKYINNMIISDSVLDIDDMAFVDCYNIVIHGKKGSYGESYANKNMILFKEL